MTDEEIAELREEMESTVRGRAQAREFMSALGVAPGWGRPVPRNTPPRRGDVVWDSEARLDVPWRGILWGSWQSPWPTSRWMIGAQGGRTVLVSPRDTGVN